jgi:hypothetical protein
MAATGGVGGDVEEATRRAACARARVCVRVHGHRCRHCRHGHDHHSGRYQCDNRRSEESGSGSGWRVLGWAGRSLRWSNTNLRGPWPARSFPAGASRLPFLAAPPCCSFCGDVGRCSENVSARCTLGPIRVPPHSVNVTHAHTSQHAHPHHPHHHHHDHDHVHHHHHHHHCSRLHLPPTWPDLSALCALASPTTLWRLPLNAWRQRCDDYLPTRYD